MFDLFSWSHILILLVVALVVVGPKDLPKLMRTAGQWTGKARAMANEFRKSFDEMARQSELDELRKEIDALRNERPLSGVEREFNDSILPPEHRSVPPVENVMKPLPDAPGANAPPTGPLSEPFIDHSKVDEEPELPDPEHVMAIGRNPPAP